MATRLAVLGASLIAALVPSAWATDPAEAAAVVASKSPGSLIEPRIDPGIALRNRRKITVSFRIAVKRVVEVPECRAMFTELGADAPAALGNLFFLPIGWHELKPHVCADVSVYTLVGGGPVWVCREFSRLSDSQAAVIIIHEALHHAGLTERPHDTDGMTSGAINHMVVKRCGL